jgi:lysylphosphatidylglycerol synthetase-like protein (DUF2156 family)
VSTKQVKGAAGGGWARATPVFTTAARAPLTVGCIAALWSIGVITGSLRDGPPPDLFARVGAGIPSLAEGHWWSPLTAALWCSGPGSYLLTTVAFAMLVGPAERILGAARTAAVLIGTQVIGSSVGLAVIEQEALNGNEWAAQLARCVAVGPSTAAVGAGLALAWRLDPPERRRFRLLLLVGLVMLTLYSGSLQDVLRLATGLVGLTIGAGWAALRPRPAARAAGVLERRRLIALLVAAGAIGPLVAVISHTMIGPLSVLRFVLLAPPPGAGTVEQLCRMGAAAADECRALQAHLRLSGTGPAIMSVLPVVALVVIADGLRRGRRFAWAAAVAAHLLLAALGAVLAVEMSTTPPEQLVVFADLGRSQTLLATLLPLIQPLLIAAVLVAARGAFTVTAPRGTYRGLTIRLVATLTALSLLYLGGGWLLRDQFDRPPGLIDLLFDLPLRFLPPAYLGELEPAFLPTGAAATLLFEWTGVVALAVTATALAATFRRDRLDPPTDEVSAQVRALLAKHGTSLAHMITWAGHQYWFTPDEGAVVAYRVIAGVAVTTGGPVGPPRAQADALSGFAQFCARHGWTPCLYCLPADHAAEAAQMGWHTVQVAQEAVVALPELAFTGKKWQDIRTARNRARKAGIIAEWCHFATSPRVITDQIRAISADWAARKPLPEMAFTLGGLSELADPQVRCLIAVDVDGTVHGVTSWMPVHRDGHVIGWTLDFMRRRRTGFAPVTEFLIAAAAETFQAEGATLLSLSGAPLARTDPDPDEVTGPMQRLLDQLGERLEPVYGFRSLLAFKAKFQPSYRPLFMAYPDATALPTIGAAITRAYLPHLTRAQIIRLLRLLLPNPQQARGARAELPR